MDPIKTPYSLLNHINKDITSTENRIDQIEQNELPSPIIIIGLGILFTGLGATIAFYASPITAAPSFGGGLLVTAIIATAFLVQEIRHNDLSDAQITDLKESLDRSEIVSENNKLNYDNKTQTKTFYTHLQNEIEQTITPPAPESEAFTSEFISQTKAVSDIIESFNTTSNNTPPQNLEKQTLIDVIHLDVIHYEICKFQFAALKKNIQSFLKQTTQLKILVTRSSYHILTGK